MLPRVHWQSPLLAIIIVHQLIQVSRFHSLNELDELDGLLRLLQE